MPPRQTHPPERPRTLLVVDSDLETLEGLRQELHRAGFETAAASSASDAALHLDAGPEEVSGVVVCQPLALEVLSAVRAREGMQPNVVVRGRPSEQAVTEAYAAGADDFVALDAPLVELVGRLRGLLRNRDYLDRLAQKERDAQAMLELTQALASSLDFSEILHTVVRRLAEVMNVDRASIVLSPDGDQPEIGFVVATSDDREIANLQIDLEKYPEIQQVLRTREPLTIADTTTHPVLDGVRDNVPADQVGALSLLPIVWQDQAMGVLFLRSARRGTLSSREIAFCRSVANATAIALRNARVMQSLRDQTQKVNFARFEAERRLRALKRYANLFTSAADGLAAVDPDGKMLFANPRAYEIAGVGEEEIRGQFLRKLIDPADHKTLLDIWRGVRDGDFPRGVDLRMRRPDGDVRIVSCSFSALLESEGAILVSFRDVTKDRETAAELLRTKEFLESLINASVDAIIAADMKGEILLFNEGAERIYGHRAEDVVHQMHVTQLYPEGRAYEVMRLLRSPGHGGEGRLESIRFDAIDKNGVLLPIMLSAAMIFDEQGKPSATVGIFTDLREKLRVEERLAQAQQKLAVTEKQALIAELAGTAAHELNQPLTSVIGYGELLQRKLSAGSPEHHAAEVIVREAERMADIVRKIGKITRYETKSYVGAQKILDLDKAAGDRAAGERTAGDRPAAEQTTEDNEGNAP
ncbi:MAG: PAS domain S-box protein [Myxococcota bacterium]|nr:PAS domain S-box protein [Myxococcota bacterium]